MIAIGSHSKNVVLEKQKLWQYFRHLEFVRPQMFIRTLLQAAAQTDHKTVSQSLEHRWNIIF